MTKTQTVAAQAAILLLWRAVPAMAQAPPAYSVAVGAITGPGWPGALAAVRLNVSIGAKAGLDFDAGRIINDEPIYAGHVTWQLREQSAHGPRTYFAVGFAHLKSSNITTIVWSSQERTVLVHEAPSFVPQVGVGADWRSAHGVRVGIEGTSGGSESGGPVIHAKIFVLWGRPRR